MKWKHLFPAHILARGMDYYSNTQVAIEEIAEDQILATVEGSDLYEVNIKINGKKISHMYCDCPYAEGGSNCKHMAAVLYAAEQEYEALLESPADKKSLSEAIAALPRDVDVYEKADINTRRRMFRQLRSSIEYSQNFCESFLADSLISIFIEPEFSLELLIDVDSALQTASDKTIDSLISQRISLMEHLGLSKKEQLDFLQPFTNHTYARQLQIDLLIFEELWETLMKKIEFSADTMLLNKHEEALGSRFPNRVRDLWIRIAEAFMLHANDRGAYRYAASLLGNAMYYPGGKEKAFAVASTWKLTYPRRTALREELKKVGL